MIDKLPTTLSSVTVMSRTQKYNNIMYNPRRYAATLSMHPSCATRLSTRHPQNFHFWPSVAMVFICITTGILSYYSYVRLYTSVYKYARVCTGKYYGIADSCIKLYYMLYCCRVQQKSILYVNMLSIIIGNKLSHQSRPFISCVYYNKRYTKSRTN